MESEFEKSLELERKQLFDFNPDDDLNQSSLFI
jgi:hypothetical protein